MQNLIEKMELLDFGLINTQDLAIEKEKIDDSPIGYFWWAKNIEFSQETCKIPAKIGTAFGIKYSVTDVARMDWVDFECKIIHPTLTNLDTSNTFSNPIEAKSNLHKEPNFDFLFLSKIGSYKQGIGDLLFNKIRLFF